jgi:hypothetical protein
MIYCDSDYVIWLQEAAEQLTYLEPPDSLCVSAYVYYCDSDYIIW